VLAGVGWVGHGSSGPGSGTAGEALARAEWVGRGRGGPGSCVARVAPAKEARVGHRRHRASAAATRGAVGGGGGAHRYTVCGRDARERDAGERKGGAGYTRLCSSGRHIS
jgi:hypothetical protein